MLTTIIDISGPAGWVAMLLPLVLLAVVVIGVVVGRDKAPALNAAQVPAAKGGGPGVHAEIDRPELVQRQVGDSARRPARDGATALVGERLPVQVPPDQHAVGGAADAQELPWGDVRRGRESVQEQSGENSENRRLEAALADAEQRFDDAAVARLSLELACALLSSGTQSRDVQTLLRRSIILSTRLKDDETHARARLELGDVMATDGDMTTACEHWQIARQIYWDGDKDKVADVDQRMVSNGCPTDWVLNDF